MDSITLIIIGGAVATAFALKRYKSKQKRIKKTMRQAPFKRIEQVEDGETVTIAGNVVFHKRFMNAPLSNRECIYYHATVERKKSSGKTSSWSKVIDEGAAVNFILDDGHHQALVEANAFEGFLEMDKHLKAGPFKSTTPTQEAFLKKYNIKAKDFLGFDKPTRYKEGALEKHEYCIVHGTCYWEDAIEHDIEDIDRILVIKSSNTQPVFLTDVKDILT